MSVILASLYFKGKHFKGVMQKYVGWSPTDHCMLLFGGLIILTEQKQNLEAPRSRTAMDKPDCNVYESSRNVTLLS